MTDRFSPRQILIVHEEPWDAMQRWAADHRWHLERVPDYADPDGVPYFAEDRPGTECPRCGHAPTYAFMPDSPAQ